VKYIYLPLFALLILACQQKVKTPPSSEKKIEITDKLLGKDWEGNEILVGEVTYDQMAFYTKEWFLKEYNNYKVNQKLVTDITPLLKGKEVILYMGTWCESIQ